MAAPPPVYLAGPDVFLPDAREVGEAKRAVCARYGLEGRFPLDTALADEVAEASPEEQGLAIFELCVEMMDGCVAGIVNLSPFRGPSADVGTAVEVGYLLASGRDLFGYTSAVAHYDERVGADGWTVERYGLADNLMVEGAVRRSGHPVVRVASSTPERALVAMEAFERCVALAARSVLRGVTDA